MVKQDLHTRTAQGNSRRLRRAPSRNANRSFESNRDNSSAKSLGANSHLFHQTSGRALDDMSLFQYSIDPSQYNQVAGDALIISDDLTINDASLYYDDNVSSSKQQQPVTYKCEQFHLKHQRNRNCRMMVAGAENSIPSMLTIEENNGGSFSSSFGRQQRSKHSLLAKDISMISMDESMTGHTDDKDTSSFSQPMVSQRMVGTPVTIQENESLDGSSCYHPPVENQREHANAKNSFMVRLWKAMFVSQKKDSVSVTKQLYPTMRQSAPVNMTQPRDLWVGTTSDPIPLERKRRVRRQRKACRPAQLTAATLEVAAPTATLCATSKVVLFRQNASGRFIPLSAAEC